MTEQATTAAVRRSVTVPLSQEKAFELFVDRFGDWWPKGGSHSLTQAQVLYLDPEANGRWGEQDPDGGYCPWGRVLRVERPHRILLAWQLSPEFTYEPDRAKQTEVEVRFEPEGAEATRVTLEHRGFEVWGEKGAEMRDSVGSDKGWREPLELYVQLAAA
jgi:uncharacterized protein YndB with AHSA1/START domain